MIEISKSLFRDFLLGINKIDHSDSEDHSPETLGYIIRNTVLKNSLIWFLTIKLYFSSNFRLGYLFPEFLNQYFKKLRPFIFYKIKACYFNQCVINIFSSDNTRIFTKKMNINFFFKLPKKTFKEFLSTNMLLIVEPTNIFS